MTIVIKTIPRKPLLPIAPPARESARPTIIMQDANGRRHELEYNEVVINKLKAKGWKVKKV